jgi:hypothetical protein
MGCYEPDDEIASCNQWSLGEYWIPVPIVNPIRWKLIVNRAMLLLDVRFVQTDLWDGHRPASVASCA